MGKGDKLELVEFLAKSILIDFLFAKTGARRTVKPE